MRKLLIPLIAVMLLGVIGIANAAYAPTCAWKVGHNTGRNSPTASSGTLAGSMTFNVSWSNNNVDSGSSNITNVVFYYRQTGGTWHILQNKTIQAQVNMNITNATIYNTTWPVSTDIGTGNDLCYDTKTYELRVLLINSTKGTATQGQPCTVSDLTGLYCDNTKPQCSIKLPVASTTYKTGQTVLADAGNTSNCVWAIGNQYTGVINGTGGKEDCYYTFTQGQPPQPHIYDSITLTTKDLSGNTSICTATYVTFDDDNPNALKAAAIVIGQDEIIKQSQQQKNIGIAILVILIIIIAAHYYNKNK